MSKEKKIQIHFCSFTFLEMKVKRILIALIALLFIYEIKSDEICDSIIIDAITTLHNQTIALFRKNEVWLLNRGKEILGPCPVSKVYNEMKGPVDAAVTILNHETIVDFIGSSIYFQNGDYFTFKNLNQYQVEWGALVYLPRKGSQAKMGSTVPEAVEMKTKISAAYFDPIEGRTKLVFSDLSVLGFNFEFGPEFDTPVLSNLSSELKKFGVEKPLNNISAALTLNTSNGYKLYLFDRNNYCSIKMSTDIKSQNCEFKPIKDTFLNCDKIVRKNGYCNAFASVQPIDDQKAKDEGYEKPITVDGRPSPEKTKDLKTKGVLTRNVGPSSPNDNKSEKLSANKNIANQQVLNAIIYFLNFLILFYDSL